MKINFKIFVRNSLILGAVFALGTKIGSDFADYYDVIVALIALIPLLCIGAGLLSLEADN